jgi:hypothetical protein
MTRYYLEWDENGLRDLWRGAPGMERWRDGGWESAGSYTWMKYQGVGGDAYNAREITEADLPATQAALAARWAERYFVRTDNDNVPMYVVRVRDWGHRGVHVWNADAEAWAAVPDKQAVLIEVEPGANTDYDEVSNDELAGVLRRLKRKENN